MQREQRASERVAEAPAAAPGAAAASPYSRIIGLQRSVGNRAVAQLVARAERSKPWFADAPALPSGDWYVEDRKAGGGTWHTANEHNLRTGAAREYPTAALRSDFYRWFYEASTAKGHETRWPLAASIVSAGVGDIVHMSSASEGILGKGINELQGMMREGNQVIFENVFPKLAKLYDSAPVTGQAALDWDAMTLAEEQNLIQPLYKAASSDARKILSGIAKGDWATQLGAAVASDADVVKAGKNIKAGDVPYFPESGDLLDVSQRFAYGLKLASTFSTIKPAGTVPSGPPTPDASYLDGTALRRVDTRRNLHFFDAIIDTTVNPDEQDQAAKRMALFSGSEQARFLSDYADRVVSAGIWPRTLMAGMATWAGDLETELSFIDKVMRKSGSWVDVKYSQVQPMIQASQVASRKKISGARWKKIFIDICDDDTIDTAVTDLGLSGDERAEWIKEEKSVF